MPAMPRARHISSERHASSLDAARDWFQKSFQPDSAQHLEAHYRFELENGASRVLSLRIQAGRLDLSDTALPEPDVVFRLRADDLLGVLQGGLNPDLLMMEDRLKIEGDLSLALKLRTLFRASG